MAFIGSLLDSSKGAGFTAQSGSPVTSDQSQQAINNTNTGLDSQQALAQALAAQGGIQNQNQVYNQLQGVANGTGPNPAQALLAQQTGANVANQAALMAGQRGAGANAGLIARQAAQQGANTQQQAVGQGATMQANQSLNAINSAGSLANTQVANQIGAQQGLTAAQQGQQNSLLGSQLQNASQQNQSNTAIAQGNQKSQAGLLGGVVSGLGSALALANGGMIGAIGKGIAGDDSAPAAPQASQGSGLFDKLLSGIASPVKSAIGSVGDSLGSMVPVPFADGGKVPALVSPGEKILSPEQAKAAKGGKIEALNGKTVPGTPTVGGAKNSYANDTVPANLSPGSVVLPRSVTQAKDPKAAAEKFIAALKSKSSKK
jgi:hypothetical protein